ncbi:ASKHA domain-containing protein [Desulfotomaculum copahuensis]|uniref:Ferredoxin n=1 Tax=Desulfotomaculum copahuensis TaxID=1838280 RepID=A0A1B7LKD2_9FIRM|nr:ASKHA domain-containing protein [Desulfotomaculum copahuensis]OAT87034.1 ferredoxin [Desulfotomaculum copahuensis]
MAEFSVRFLPDDKTVTIREGETLLQAAAEANIPLKASCGGNGTCGRCRMIVREGEVKQLQTGKLTAEQQAAGYVLACQSIPQCTVVVEVPAESRLSEHRVLLAEDRSSRADLPSTLDPLFQKVKLTVPPATLDDSRDDAGRTLAALKQATGIDNARFSLEALNALPGALRRNGWQVTLSLADVKGYIEITGVEPGFREDNYYGLAVDIGTTTVVVQLVDLTDGRTVCVRGTYNKQAVYGDDVISRIVYAVDNKDGRQEMQKAVVDTINELIDQMLPENNIAPADVRAVACAGNTTMTHLFLGIDPEYIRLEPYTPAANSLPPVPAGELGLHINPRALVHCLPGVASYVGGDIMSGARLIEIDRAEELTLFIDVGTNGEMVLGNREWLLACACSAGPAFEGGGITNGMRAMAGAIEHVEIDPANGEVTYNTVGDAKPLGICGSGLIDLISALREAGIIDRTGQFLPRPDLTRWREGDDGPEYVLARAAESGNGKDIVITEADVKNLIRSKGAIFAGIRTMLRMVDLPVEAIDRILIAGGFGRYIGIQDAISIGLFPDVPLEKYKYIGNSSVKGAKMALLSRRVRDEVEALAAKVTYLELSVGNEFMDEFVSALFLPHTDINLFPSLIHAA